MKAKPSQLEQTLALQLRATKIHAPEREWRFCERQWRFDFAWPEKKLAVECEGGVWTNGRHTRGSGFVKDLEKYNRATVLGWRVLRFASEHIQSGQAIQTIQEALNDRA